MTETTEIMWLIEEALWRRMRAAPASQRRVGALINRLEHDILGNRFMGRGYLGENQVKLRFTDKLRLPVVVERAEDSGDAGLLVYLYDVVDHREGEQLHQTGVTSPSAARFCWRDLRWEQAELERATFQKPVGKLFRKLEIQRDRTSALDLVDECEIEWHLSPEQRAACDRPGPVLVCGSAGTCFPLLLLAPRWCGAAEQNSHLSRIGQPLRAPPLHLFHPPPHLCQPVASSG